MYAIRDLSPRGYTFFVFSVVTPLVASLAVLLRIWIRFFISKSFGVDDFLLLMSLLFFIGGSASDIVMALYGFGGHQDIISDENLVTLLKYLFIGAIFFYLCIISLRLSLCSLFLRITPVPWQKRIIYGVALITTIINTLNLFRLNIFNCSPVSFYWYYYLYPDAGVCISVTVQENLLYAQYTISVAADLVMSLLPLFLLKNSTMNTKTKFLTLCLFGMGIFASAAGIATIAFTSTTGDYVDYTFQIYPIFVAQMAEPFIGILAASFITYRPLLLTLTGTIKDHLSQTGQRISKQMSDGLEEGTKYRCETDIDGSTICQHDY